MNQRFNGSFEADRAWDAHGMGKLRFAEPMVSAGLRSRTFHLYFVFRGQPPSTFNIEHLDLARSSKVLLDPGVTTAVSGLCGGVNVLHRSVSQTSPTEPRQLGLDLECLLTMLLTSKDL